MNKKVSSQERYLLGIDGDQHKKKYRTEYLTFINLVKIIL
jgi:hypothetical protein